MRKTKMRKTKFVLVAKDWSPIIGEGQTAFEEYEDASKKARELAPRLGGVIITSEKGLFLKGLQDRGYEWQITDREKGEISLLPPINA